MIVPLRDAAVNTCGGKAGALGALLRAGLPVPDGFVVPFDAYRLASVHGPDAVDGLLEELADGLDELGDVTGRGAVIGRQRGHCSRVGRGSARERARGTRRRRGRRRGADLLGVAALAACHQLPGHPRRRPSSGWSGDGRSDSPSRGCRGLRGDVHSYRTGGQHRDRGVLGPRPQRRRRNGDARRLPRRSGRAGHQHDLGQTNPARPRRHPTRHPRRTRHRSRATDAPRRDRCPSRAARAGSGSRAGRAAGHRVGDHRQPHLDPASPANHRRTPAAQFPLAPRKPR